MIIIPGQGGTYRHLHARVTHLLAESGQMTIASSRSVQESRTAGIPDAREARNLRPAILLMLRHQNAVLRWTAKPVAYEPADRAWFAAGPFLPRRIWAGSSW
jgi:hypothetical protein